MVAQTGHRAAEDTRCCDPFELVVDDMCVCVDGRSHKVLKRLQEDVLTLQRIRKVTRLETPLVCLGNGCFRLFRFD